MKEMRAYFINERFWISQSENNYWVAINVEETKTYVSHDIKEALEKLLSWVFKKQVNVVEIYFDNENERLIAKYLDDSGNENEFEIYTCF